MISASKIIDATFNPVSLYVKTKYRNKENKKTILQELFGKLGHNHEDAIYEFLHGMRLKEYEISWWWDPLNTKQIMENPLD